MPSIEPRNISVIDTSNYVGPVPPNHATLAWHSEDCCIRVRQSICNIVQAGIIGFIGGVVIGGSAAWLDGKNNSIILKSSLGLGAVLGAGSLLCACPRTGHPANTWIASTPEEMANARANVPPTNQELRIYHQRRELADRELEELEAGSIPNLRLDFPETTESVIDDPVNASSTEQTNDLPPMQRETRQTLRYPNNTNGASHEVESVTDSSDASVAQPRNISKA